jgi:hypothetical protein
VDAKTSRKVVETSVAGVVTSAGDVETKAEPVEETVAESGAKIVVESVAKIVVAETVVEIGDGTTAMAATLGNEETTDAKSDAMTDPATAASRCQQRIKQRPMPGRLSGRRLLLLLETFFEECSALTTGSSIKMSEMFKVHYYQSWAACGSKKKTYGFNCTTHFYDRSHGLSNWAWVFSSIKFLPGIHSIKRTSISPRPLTYCLLASYSVPLIVFDVASGDRSMLLAASSSQDANDNY